VQFFLPINLLNLIVIISTKTSQFKTYYTKFLFKFITSFAIAYLKMIWGST